MKKISLFFLTLSYAFFPLIHSTLPTFTHKLTRGRLGDHLISYAQCKYLSWKYNVPMFYRPFKHSSQFLFTTQDNVLTSAISKQFAQKTNVNHETQLDSLNPNTLYDLNFNIKINGGIEKAIWENPKLQSILKYAWSPLLPIKSIDLPKDMITIALHVRKGSGHDYPLSSKQIYPSCFGRDITNNNNNQTKIKKLKRQAFSDRGDHALKFPPEQYYIDQLMLLSELLDNPKLYVYIFTDSKEPKKLTERLAKYTNKTNIIFDCRDDQSNNRASEIEAILQDFYNMAQFNIIIRANSNLSKAAQLIGDHLVGVYPHTCYWEKDRLIINSSHIIIRNRESTAVKVYKLPTEQELTKEDLQDIFSR